MTVRLYRDNSFLWRFTAQVRERLTSDGSPAVVLDQTAFYPSAGGQPNDLGSLAGTNRNGVNVIDVIEREDGEIVHVLAEPLAELDPVVEGIIDVARRVDHMQQHSGQHVLSQSFVTTAELDTIAVHIGTDESTLDLPSPRLTPAAIERAEDEANRIVFEDRQVIVRELSDIEVAQLPLRKPPKVTGQIRIVEIEGFDWSACGGTHVRSSAQIGMIRVTKAEKRGDTTRIYFRCGGRALADYRDLSHLALALGENFRMSRADILPAIDRLREDAKAARKELAEAQGRLLEYEAQELLREHSGVIARSFDARDANSLKLMAKRLTSGPGVIALLASHAGDRTYLCFARSADVKTDVSALLRGALATLNPATAKGGGSVEFAQGSGPVSDAASARAALDWAVLHI